MSNPTKEPTRTKSTIQKKRATPVTWDKLKDAPSQNLPFPSNGNITAIELITFLPSSIKSWDVIERFISNSANVPILAYILNTNRNMPYGKMAHNSMLRLMQCQARLRPEKRYEGWTVKKHVRPRGWDERAVGLRVAGYRTQAQVREKPSDVPRPFVSFKDLANGVKNIPTGKDALDLTRCVKYHELHPDEQWYYPAQFEELVKHLGGPAVVTEDHLDSRAFARWAELRRFGSASEMSIPVEAAEPGEADEDADMEDEGELEEKVAEKEQGVNEVDKFNDEKEPVYKKDAAEAKVYKETGDDMVMDFRTALKLAGTKRSRGIPLDSEGEEIQRSWAAWKNHGIRGLMSVPIFKKQKHD